MAWKRLERNIMGLIDSPYHACSEVTWDNGMVMDNIIYPDNNVGWVRVVSNLPEADT